MTTKSVVFHLLPFAYTFQSRIQTKSYLARIIAREHFVIFFVTYYSLFHFHFTLESASNTVWQVLLAYLLFYSVYEVGYALNDEVSVRYEVVPTRRLAHPVNMPAFVAAHLVWFLGLMWLLTTRYGESLPIILGISILLAGMELVHNLYGVRHPVQRVYTFCALRILRYTFVVALLSPAATWYAFVVMLPPLIEGILTYLDAHGLVVRTFQPVPLPVPYLILMPIKLVLLGSVFWPLILPDLIILGAYGTREAIRQRRGETNRSSEKPPHRRSRS